MTKSIKRLLLIVCLVMVLTQVFIVSGKEVYTVNVRSYVPEYDVYERQMWDLFEQKYPNIKINMRSYNEDEWPAFNARMAAGDPPADMSADIWIEKEHLQYYANLEEIDFKNWDNYQYDAKSFFKDSFGIDFVPAVNAYAGPFYTFLYYKDEMDKLGLDPKKTVRTLDDLRAFLAELKKHVDKSPDLNYVWDFGWHFAVSGHALINALSHSAGGTVEQQCDLFMGKIKWDDVNKNPLVPGLKLLKEFYEKGYMPKRWWTRHWESDFESSFINKKSLLTWHGPWIWDKVLAVNPGKELDGFVLPPAPDGSVWTHPVRQMGCVIYKSSLNKPNFEAVVTAFNWWTSPEAVKMQAEVRGHIPLYDLSSVGGVSLRHPQYLKVLKPLNEGFFGDLRWENSLNGKDMALPFKKIGTAEVTSADAFASALGDYLEGKITLASLLEMMKKRWENAYPELVKK